MTSQFTPKKSSTWTYQEVLHSAAWRLTQSSTVRIRHGRRRWLLGEIGPHFNGTHLFLFWDWNGVRLTVVHSSFTSGYRGGGPHNFSIALSMIRDREIPTNEIFVTEHQFYSIDNRRLTTELIEHLRSVEDVQIYWSDIFPRHSEQIEAQTFWTTFHQPKMNFDHIDPELSKRCRNLYVHDSEAALSRGFYSHRRTTARVAC